MQIETQNMRKENKALIERVRVLEGDAEKMSAELSCYRDQKLKIFVGNMVLHLAQKTITEAAHTNSTVKLQRFVPSLDAARLKDLEVPAKCWIYLKNLDEVINT